MQTLNVANTIGCVLSRTLLWFQKAVPTPTPKNISVQIGCHCEEVSEFVQSLTGTDHATRVLIDDAQHVMHKLAEHLKANHDRLEVNDRRETLDGICDQLVTAAGVGHMLRMDVLGGLNEVNSSNWSKFTNGEPVFDANGKIAKGSGYFKPDLSPFVG